MKGKEDPITFLCFAKKLSPKYFLSIKAIRPVL